MFLNCLTLASISMPFLYIYIYIYICIEIYGQGGSMNKQDTGFLQSRKLEEVQLPKTLPPRTGSSHVENNDTCAAPSSATALEKPRFLLRPSRRRENGSSQGKAQGEWRQSRKDSLQNGYLVFALGLSLSFSFE